MEGSSKAREPERFSISNIIGNSDNFLRGKGLFFPAGESLDIEMGEE